MPKGAAGLTDRQVKTRKAAGLIADGGGLYLQISPGGSKSWIFRFKLAGKRRDMGLGSVSDVSLAEAREAARVCRKITRDGRDPIEERRAERAAAALESARAMTFRQCAEAYIQAHQTSWKKAVHARQWPSTLEAYVFPIMGDLSVAAIDTATIMRVLDLIWTEKPETASRVRGRIEAILDWAAAAEYRPGNVPNPARWKGHLQNLLPRKTRVRQIAHHAALNYNEMPEFMDKLRAQNSIAAQALELAILTAARTSEVLGATWSEIDLEARVWVIPGSRMKAGREHHVPLSDAAMAILEGMQKIRTGDHVFFGNRTGRPLATTALLKVLQRIEYDVTVHGFRSTFSDWCAGQTNFPSEVRELSLAHSVGSKVELAYRRGDQFEKRRQLMGAWAKYCTMPAPAGRVVNLQVRHAG